MSNSKRSHVRLRIPIPHEQEIRAATTEQSKRQWVDRPIRIGPASPNYQAPSTCLPKRVEAPRYPGRGYPCWPLQPGRPEYKGEIGGTAKAGGAAAGRELVEDCSAPPPGLGSSSLSGATHALRDRPPEHTQANPERRG